MTQLIAFTGYKRTGKSTAAEYLEKEYGYVRHNFKDGLISELKERFPDLLEEILVTYMDYGDYFFNIGHTVENLFTTKPPLIRALMQNYGTEVRRRDNPEYWVYKWFKKAVAIQKYQPSNIVTDDVRFLNEAEAVKDFGGIIIRLTRPDIETGGDHSSETEQLEIEADYTIKCVPGDISHLHRALDGIVRVWRTKKKQKNL